MKKKKSKKKQADFNRVETDIWGLILKLEQHIVSLDRKIEILISRMPGAAPEARPSNWPPHLFDRNGNKQHNQGKDSRPAERVMYKAVCADCKKNCEVPFRPSQDRPVYCKECYAKRRNGRHQAHHRPHNQGMHQVVVQKTEAPKIAKKIVRHKKKIAKRTKKRS